LVGVMSPF